MKNTHSGLQMDPVSTLKRNQSITLRSTRRIYKKWGIKYHAAVRDAVFMMHSMPLVPLKPPASLKCDNEESDLVYVCQQCRDCFWFKSSFEDHSQRHSWILGFWCQKCFLTVCTHVPNSNSPCDLCVNIERDKRSYMRKKGIHKHQKMGTIRVFYNQCQFFAHLRLHNMSLVNICDIMLMPLPNMEIDWTPKLDTACEALLEYCFMKRVHIMDWFRAKNVDHNWWQLVESNIEDTDNPITKILKTYNGSNLFNSDIAKVDADLIPLAAMYRTSSKSSTVGLTKIALEKNEKDYNKNIKNISNVTTGSSVPNQDTDEDEDNPCSPTDITFVDCDSTYNTYSPFADYSSRNSKMTNSKYMQYIKNNTQSTVNKKQSKKKKLKKEVVNYITSVSSSPNRSSNFISTKEFSNQNLDKDISYMQKDLAHKCSGNAKLSTVAINTQNGSVDNIIKKSITKNANLLPNLSHKGIMNQEYQKQNYLSVLKNDSNLLTFQGTDSVKMNGLIAQIPSHLRANNKILFIGQDMDGVNKKANHAILDAKFREKDIKTMSTKLKSLHMCNNAISEDNKNTSNLSKIAIESNKTKIHQIPLESKIMYRNGSRYVIAHTSNFQSSTPTSPDSSNNMQIVRYNTKNQNGVTKLTSVENTYLNLSETNVSLPTPSPSSSELSNSSSCEAQRKQNLSIACTQKGLETSRNHLKPKFKHSILDLLNDDVLCETLSFRRAENAEIYLNIKRTKSSTKQLNVVTTVTIPNCRQDMLNEFRQLNSLEIKERILHLQDVRTEILKVMNFAGDRDIENTLKSIKNLQKGLEDVLESCNHESEDMKDVWNDQEVLLNEWESECQLSGNELRCATCSKIMKPKTYIPGFSKPAENDTIYCSCYKHFCQECRSYQGNVTRFLTHQNFHEEEKPYACPDCFRRFPSFRLLEGHTWSFCFHMLKKRVFCCKICQIDGFQDTESIARHFAIMHSTKKIACETCYMVLDTYSEYKRHRDKMHSTVLKFEPIRLMICKLGQCINRYEKYMMHLEKHYGVRKITWLKCPFCSYYNLESKQFLIQFKIHFQIVHLNRLVEIIKPETLKDILPTSLSECLFKEKESLIYDNERFKKQKHIDEKERLGSIVPKILNTRTIPSEDFDRVSENIESITRNNKSLHSIQSTIKNGVEDKVRSENTGSSIFQAKMNKEDNLPKILDIISINDVLLKDQKCSSNIADVEEITINIKEIQSNADKTKKLRSVINDQSEETCNSPKENIKNDPKCTESDNGTPENNGEVQNIITKLKQSNTTITEILKPIIKDSKVPANVSRTSGSLETNLTVSNCNNMPNEIETCDNINSTSITKSEQVTALSSSNDSINSENTQKIPKPPPLIRIPEYILESRNHQEVKKIKKKKRTISGNRKTNIKRLCRIALNGPTNSKDVHQDYLCHLCGELINTAWPIISTHFNKRHTDDCKLSILTPRLLRITPEFINGGYKELFSNKKRKSDGTLPKEQSSKKKRKWSTKKHTDSNNSFGEGLYVEQESVEDGKGNFICRRCDQRCANMSDLRKHIASNHRIKGRYLVCLECGENFVVAPSLQMHLKAFHGIEDPISYMNQNSSYAPDNINDLENETKAMIANQCYVCMAVFEDKAAVDKHLRVHGMAFLNRKRIEAQNALKSSDKNIKVNDDKQSFQKESTKTPIKRDNPSNTILEKINATILEEAQ
ncbi:uncharacterized protein LOC118441152 isoform X1 [Vespa mandarinia]|uniref:uncharacterized protein LOC118441152 isoform X1 n=2 Tax=Vespa mandarinia TaxID=7446 RepID=UPI001618C928|nr:uncharacterized protein LOC118441152 isoform X1 [Vespa mandarinia]XP_035721073.1 uncharacterized protein LOC118441152 isoform X1 [Vespa mandarinia]